MGNAWLKMVNGGGVWKLRERNGEQRIFRKPDTAKNQNHAMQVLLKKRSALGIDSISDSQKRGWA